MEKEKDQKEKTLTIYGLDSIEENDFKGAKYLTNVISYSNTLSSIANNAFEGCEKLAAVQINGNTQSIGNYAFKDCKLCPCRETSAVLAVFRLPAVKFWIR